MLFHSTPLYFTTINALPEKYPLLGAAIVKEDIRLTHQGVDLAGHLGACMVLLGDLAVLAAVEVYSHTSHGDDY